MSKKEKKANSPNFHWWRPTVTRDLTVGLLLTAFAVFGIAIIVNYFFSAANDSIKLKAEATALADQLETVIASSMWDLDDLESQRIVEFYLQSPLILGIELIDENGKHLAKMPALNKQPFLILNRLILHDKKEIGQLKIAFSNATILAKQREFALYSLIIFLCLSLAIFLSTSFLLRRFLLRPFKALADGLAIISKGDYSHILPPARQYDIQEITAGVNAVAREVAQREQQLEMHNNKLEILNEAILEIFSCSDTNNLIKTTLALTHRVCGVGQGWFLAETNETGDEADKGPEPLVCVQGKLYPATPHEAEAQQRNVDDTKIFEFALKSRYRTVGKIILCFAYDADPSTQNLLRSLMSLMNLAMVRQSFIRETAFIQTELQIASTVQRSMLPAQNIHNADISYHYEPVLRVGGDWFQIIEANNDRSVYIILGDVTGHGLAQGLVTTATAGAMHVTAATIHDAAPGELPKPSQIVRQLNDLIMKIADKSRLRMTCVAARLNFEEGKMEICNAGHTFPLHSIFGGSDKPKPCVILQQPMLGEDTIEQPFAYEDAAYSLDPHDTMIFYTDGLLEAEDRQGRNFQRKFLRKFKEFSTYRTSSDIKNNIISGLFDHTKGSTIDDDVCLVVVRKKSA